MPDVAISYLKWGSPQMLSQLRDDRLFRGGLPRVLRALHRPMAQAKEAKKCAKWQKFVAKFRYCLYNILGIVYGFVL